MTQQHTNDNNQLALSATTALTMFALTATTDDEQSPARSFHICNQGNIRTVSVHGDATELLVDLSKIPLPRDVVAIGIHSSERTTPIATEQPSEHPQQQQVQAVIVVDRDFRVVTAARLELTPDEIHLAYDNDGHMPDVLVGAMTLSMRLSHKSEPQ